MLLLSPSIKCSLEPQPKFTQSLGNLTITGAIHVTLSLKDEKTRNKEIIGLTEAMNAHNLKQGLILTKNESETFRIDDKDIEIITIYE